MSRNSGRSSDPNEWANKRKAAMERAKQLKEERKHGIADDEHTFAPQVNKRPSFLEDKPAEHIDRSNIRADDPFEQPLPGRRVYSEASPNIEAGVVGRETRQPRQPQHPISPGSDSLGKEVKKFPTGNVTSLGEAIQKSKPSFKSKFMQQYDENSNVGNDYEPTITGSRTSAAAEADEIFSSQLRGGDGLKQSPRGAPSWNDDITPSEGFGQPKPVRNNPRRSQLRQQQQDQIDDRQTEPVARRGLVAKAPSEWDSDFVSADVIGKKPSPIKFSPRGGTTVEDSNAAGNNRISPRAGRQSSDATVTQAKSRLSLLKSKIRRSESGNGARTDAIKRANSSDVISGSDMMGRDLAGVGMPKSAPFERGGGGGGGGSSARGGFSEEGEFGSIGHGRSQGFSRGGPPSPRQTASSYDPSVEMARGDRQPRREKLPPNQQGQGGLGGRRGQAAHFTEDDDDVASPRGVPATRQPVGRARRPPQQQQQRQQQQQQYDDDEYDQPPPQRQAPQRQQQRPPQQRQQQQQQQQYGDDEYDQPPPQRQAPQRQQQRPPQQRQQQQQQQQYDDDEYDQPPPQRQAPQRQQQRPPQQRQQQQQQQQYEDDEYDQPPPQRQAPQRQAPPQQMTEYPPADDEEEQGAVGEQLQCPDCGRKFNPIPYEKHIKICAKVFLQKRKAFDSTKMRVADNPELAKLLQQKQKEERMKAKADAKSAGRAAATASRNEETPVGGDAADKAAKWKDQSKAFRDAMKAARQFSQAVASGAPLPPPVISAPDPSLVPCPHCSRRFNEKAAERHIPQCQNIKAKPSSLKRGSGGSAVSTAVTTKVGGKGGGSNGRFGGKF